jgi:diguanylate cyclase
MTRSSELLISSVPLYLAGDQLLRSVSSRLVTCVRGSDTVSRQGGDEFVLLLSEIKHKRDAGSTAAKILAKLAAPHAIDKHSLRVTASLGVSTYPEDGDDAETLIQNADTAMYQAKETGRNRYQFFERDQNKGAANPNPARVAYSLRWTTANLCCIISQKLI